MKINQIIINEMTSGSVATVAMPLGKTQKRTEEAVNVPGLKPVDKIARAKKKGPYQNSLVESKMAELDIARQDLERMTPQQFFAAYKMTKQQWLAKYSKIINPQKVEEAKLDEDDIIVVPGQKMKRKTGFVQHGQSRVDHEVEMARSDVLATMKNAKAIYELLKDRSEDEGIEGWVQEKLIKANDYLNAVKEYYDEKMMQEMTGGVIASGMPGESVNESDLPITKAKEKTVLLKHKTSGKEISVVKSAVKDYEKRGYVPAKEQTSEGAKYTPDMIAKMNKQHQEFYKKNPHMASGKDIQTMAPGAMATKVTPMNKPAQVKKKPMTPFGKLEEKAVSKAQQRFMGMAHAIQKGKKIPGASKELKDVAKGMSKKDAHDFAATKHKGLPEKVKKKD